MQIKNSLPINSLVTDNVYTYSVALLFISNLVQFMHINNLKLQWRFIIVKLNDCYACMLENESEITA